MPEPLPSDVVARLRSDSTAALAAAMVLASSFPDLVVWAMGAFSGKERAKAEGMAETRDVRVGPAVRQSIVEQQSHSVKTANGHPAPREAAAKHDQALLALMRANPGASVTELIHMNHRPRNSTVLSLDRLEKAGLVKHAQRGKWTVIPPGSDPGADLLEVPAPKPAGWIEPLSANHKARHAADGRVRDELTMAAGAH